MHKVAATPLAGNQFPVSAVFVLLVLGGLVNPLLRLWGRRDRAFTPGELLTVWVLIVVPSGLPASGMMRTFIPNIVAPHYFSDARNEWERKVWGPAPEWLKLHDADAARAFFAGYPRGEEHVPWGAWAGPLFFWGIFAALFLCASFCVAALLRRPWVEQEKFAFPLVHLPVALAEAPEGNRLVSPLLRSPLLWFAVLLSTALHTPRGLHLLYPAIPDVPTSWDLAAGLADPPFNQVAPLQAILYLLVVGLAYLLPGEVGFSLWFFFLFYKAEIVLGASRNWDMPGPLGGHGGRLFHALQAFGGAVALTGWVLWSARRHLRDVWEKATRGPRAASIDDGGEMLPYRVALWGLLLSYAGIALWQWLAGIPLLLTLLSLVMITLALVVVSWAVCQAGMLFMAMPYAPIDVLGATAGTAGLPVPALYTQFRAEASFIYNTRELLLPSLLEGGKAAEAGGFSPRPLLKAMGASVIVGLVVSAVASLHLPYHHGGGNSLANAWTYNIGPQIPLKLFGNAASVPYAGSWINGLHVLGGFAGVLGLLFLRARTGFGLHPIGFLSASVYAVHMLWFSLFLGWALKCLAVRYGGRSLYLAALPFFQGLIVGDVLNAAVWIILGGLTGTGYQVMPS
jgi:hypothetical protein